MNMMNVFDLQDQSTSGDLSEIPVGDTDIFISHTPRGDITKIKSFPGVSIFHLSACVIASSLFTPRSTRHATLNA